MMTDIIRDAFIETCNGFSTDRVVADPRLNSEFVAACGRRGLTASPAELNTQLLNARKASRLQGIKATRQTSFRDQGEYQFASEIAIRFLERRDQVTLDQVICSPERAQEFDEIAARICPGYEPLQYRWSALYLRKQRSLKPELLAQVVQPEQVINLSVRDLDICTVPQGQGLYVIFDSSNTLYVGEAQNLRRRIAKHLEHSDNKGVARWLWEHGTGDLHVELQILPPTTTTKVRRALELELIHSRQPVFNVAGR